VSDKNNASLNNASLLIPKSLTLGSQQKIKREGVVKYLVTFLIMLCVVPGLGVSEEEEQIWDPIEPVNRGIFWFNDQVDYLILEPAARGYDYVVPDEVQISVKNFFRNASFPGYLFNDIVGLEFESAAIHSGRFLINSTLGVLGLFEVAEDFGLEHESNDFGVTLGRYGLGPGPYLVLPLLGPSNVRDGVGRIVDSYLDPFTLATYSDMSQDEKLAMIAGANALRLLNQRASLLKTLETAKEGSVDYYLTIQSAYYQLRRASIFPEALRAEDELEEEEDFLAE
jgi:phospholipid-binding lipoprotein MlaA